MGEQRPDPFGGPRPFVGAVDVAKWLEGDGTAAPHIVGAILAAQPERFDRLPASGAAVMAYIRAFAGA